MNVKKMIAMICAIGFLVASCKKDADAPSPSPCNTSNPDFFSLYSVTAQNQQCIDHHIYDSEVHSYSFEVSVPKTICSIGYQSQPSISQTPYLFEIWDSIANTIVYSGSHIFSATATSYASIPPLSLIPNHTYTVKRIQTNYTMYNDIIGRIIHKPQFQQMQFPIMQGSLKITSSRFYGSSSVLIDAAIPCIDLVYQ